MRTAKHAPALKCTTPEAMGPHFCVAGHDSLVAPLEPEHLSVDASDLHGLEVAVVVGGDHVGDRASSRWRDDRSLGRQHLADGRAGWNSSVCTSPSETEPGARARCGFELALGQIVEPVHIAVALGRDEQRR